MAKYKDISKESRKLFKSSGIVLLLFITVFMLVRDYALIPLFSKLWELVLKTTPEGFISNSNILEAIKRSPWIVLVALLYVVLFALLTLWQVNAIILGIEYLRSGKKIRITSLIKLSISYTLRQVQKKNYMMLVYVLFIIPFSNVYQVDDLLGNFVVPEYIQDFIKNQPVLVLLVLLLFFFVLYIALKWFFLLPSFILKRNNFKDAVKESRVLTQKHWILNGIHTAIYQLIETIRLSIIPIAVFMIPIYICYYLTRTYAYSSNLFNIFGLTIGLEIARNITGTLITMSTMCFLVSLYHARLKEQELEDVTLTDDIKETRSKISLNKLLVILSGLFSFIIIFGYLSLVYVFSFNEDAIRDIFNNTVIVAHKGYSSQAPENTDPAFELASDCDKVSCIELDVWSTKDGIPVVIHNESIKEATGVDKKIYDCTYEELQSLPACYHMDKNQYSEARIPSLEEVLEKYASQMPILIEIKGYKKDSQLPAKIVELMKKYNCEYTCLIHSGDYQALKEVKLIDPNIKCGLILAVVTGNYYDLPYADFYSIEHTFINSKTVSKLHLRGKEVYAWTVNYDDSALNMNLLGVDAMITDYPDEVNSFVADTNAIVNSYLSHVLPVPDLSDDESSGSLEDMSY